MITIPRDTDKEVKEGTLKTSIGIPRRAVRQSKQVFVQNKRENVREDQDESQLRGIFFLCLDFLTSARSGSLKETKRRISS
jgi:hypothetical protein